MLCSYGSHNCGTCTETKRMAYALVQESQRLCSKSHINENTILAGPEIHSAEFLGFLTLSHCLFFSLATSFFGKVEKSLQTVLTTPSSPHLAFSCPLSTRPYSLHTFIAESSLYINCKPVIWSWRSKALILCFQLPCHPLIPLFSVYSRIWVRKYLLRRLIPPHLISAAGRWLPAVLRGLFVWRTISKNKFCRCYKSDG